MSVVCRCNNDEVSLGKSEDETDDSFLLEEVESFDIEVLMRDMKERFNEAKNHNNQYIFELISCRFENTNLPDDGYETRMYLGFEADIWDDQTEGCAEYICDMISNCEPDLGYPLAEDWSISFHIDSEWVDYLSDHIEE